MMDKAMYLEYSIQQKIILADGRRLSVYKGQFSRLFLISSLGLFHSRAFQCEDLAGSTDCHIQQSKSGEL